MADGGFLGACSHPQRSEETVYQDVELVDVPVITHGQTEKHSYISTYKVWVRTGGASITCLFGGGHIFVKHVLCY